jgi:transposase InsO family protein
LNGPIPTRVDSAVKAGLLCLVEDAVAAGWTLSRVCGLLEVDRSRLWRWKTRQHHDRLEDARPGGRAIHGLLEWEEAEILALFEEWGPVDFSHRKLAYRGSYLDRVFVSPSSVDRVLARHGLALAGNPRPPRSVKKAWPDWVQWEPNQLWCWDATHFMACTASPVVYGIIDVVSRKWIATLLTPEATSTQVKVLFLDALDQEGLLDGLEWRLDHPEDVELSDEQAPILLAVSDNGPEMRSDTTRAFMALVTIGQHFGRPSTPTDQAWIETLWGHIKAENPHLLAITEPDVLKAELDRVRRHYNEVRLHEAIGYVTPNDEHEDRGDKIRQARRDGLQAADTARRAHHRNTTNTHLQ